LGPAIPIAAALGFFGGAGYSTGYSLMHEATRDELRGRTFSAAYTVIRIGTLIGLGLFPTIAGLVGSYTVDLPGSLGVLLLPGSRITLWLAGLLAVAGGVFSMRAIGHRDRIGERANGYFVVFEGGEGAGKSTQLTAFVEWLQARGAEVVTTREPGGTIIGRRIRDVLLDPKSTGLDPHAEALLYAADRAQHVKDVIRPALGEGKIVVSDRFVDSSLAYQGVARNLGVEEVLSISDWATGGLMPDVVFYLRVDPRTGMERSDGEPDRIESEPDDFHAKVASAYSQLARRWPGRFIVIDASRPAAEVHAEIIKAFSKRASDRAAPTASAAALDLGTPGPPVPR
jgi:dTMP kinase